MVAERFTEHLRQKAAETWEGHIGTSLCGDWRWNVCKRRAIRCSTRKYSAAAKPASVSPARTPWAVSIVGAASRATATGGLRVLVVIDCSQGRLTSSSRA